MVNLALKWLTDDLIPFDSQDCGRRLIQVNDSLSFIEDKRRFIETIDYGRDPIITFVNGSFGPHSENPADAIISGGL